MVQYDFAKFHPIYLEQIKLFGERCMKPGAPGQVAQIELDDLLDDNGKTGEVAKLNAPLSKKWNVYTSMTLEECLGKTKSFNRCIRSIEIGGIPPYDRSRSSDEYCIEAHIELVDHIKYVDRLKYRWIAEGIYGGNACDDRQLESEKKLYNTHIVDFPGCRVGCLEGQAVCSLCKFNRPDLIGILPDNGQILCNSKADAMRSVKEWCVFNVGANPICLDETKISCEKFEGTVKEAFLKSAESPSLIFRSTPTGEHSLSKPTQVDIEFETVGKVGVNIGEIAKVGEQLSYKVSAKATVGYSLFGSNLPPFNPETGLASKNAKYQCQIAIGEIRAIRDGLVSLGDLKYMLRKVGDGPFAEALIYFINLENFNELESYHQRVRLGIKDAGAYDGLIS